MAELDICFHILILTFVYPRIVFRTCAFSFSNTIAATLAYNPIAKVNGYRCAHLSHFLTSFCCKMSYFARKSYFWFIWKKRLVSKRCFIFRSHFQIESENFENHSLVQTFFASNFWSFSFDLCSVGYNGWHAFTWRKIKVFAQSGKHAKNG